LPFDYIGCNKEISRKNYATYEIKEYDFAILEWKCKMFIAKHIDINFNFHLLLSQKNKLISIQGSKRYPL